MSVGLKTLTIYIDELLEVGQFQDYAPNGLQVEGRAEVQILVSGVTACLDLIEAALERKADAILVHHGYFWRGEDARVTGMKRNRLRALLERGVSLLAYHLPLDHHPLYGNNAQLAKRLGFDTVGRFGRGDGPAIAMHGTLEPTPPAELVQRIDERLGRTPLHIAGAAERIRSIGWCTGAAQDLTGAAASLGLDAYLSGEISEHTVHVAREMGIHYFAAGHHATERYGVEALGAHLAEHFGLNHVFVDIDNPA